MKQFDIYIDGSHLDKLNNGRLGVGGILVDRSGPGLGKIINKFSTEITSSYTNMAFGEANCSNPSAELIALLHALYNFKEDIGPSDTVVIHADYMGVQGWMTGKWKIKMPYIARIKYDIDDEIRKQHLSDRISYEWVKGHQSSRLNPDAYWNNQADKLAKGLKDD